MNATTSPQCGTLMTITSAMMNAEAVPLATMPTKTRPTKWLAVTAVKIIPSIPLHPRCKSLGFFYFCFKKHLTSAPGCGIIIVGRAGPGRRPGTEFPIGSPYGKILRAKVDLHIAPPVPENPIGPHIWPHCGPKIGFDLPREQIKTPLHMPLACL